MMSFSQPQSQSVNWPSQGNILIFEKKTIKTASCFSEPRENNDGNQRASGMALQAVRSFHGLELQNQF